MDDQAKTKQQLMDELKELRQRVSKLEVVEEAQRESEAQYRRLFEEAILGIFRSTPQGTYEEVNPAFARMFGYDSPEEMKRDVTDIRNQQYVRPEDRDTIQRILASEGFVKGFEQEARRKDGKSVWVSINVTPVFDQSGKIVSYEGTSEDITQRKRAENNLRESEEKYCRLHQSVMDAVVSVDMAGRIQETNQAYQAMLGYSEEDLRRLTYIDLTPEEWHAFEARIVEEQILVKGYSDVYQKEYRKKDGTVFPVELRTFLVRDKAGHPNAMWAIVRDITERKRAERNLSESRKRLQIVLDTIPAAAFWKDRDSVYVGANRAWLDAAGLNSSQEVVGKSDYDLPWGKDQANSYREHDRKVMESGVPEYAIVEPYTRADGTLAWAKTNKVPLRDLEGNVVGILGTYEDITERKQAEQALQFETQRLRVLSENSPFGMVIIGKDGDFEYVNPKFTEIFGYDLNDVPNGRDWIQKAYPDRTCTGTRWFQPGKGPLKGYLQAKRYPELLQ